MPGDSKKQIKESSDEDILTFLNLYCGSSLEHTTVVIMPEVVKVHKFNT